MDYISHMAPHEWVMIGLAGFSFVGLILMLVLTKYQKRSESKKC